MSEHAGHRARLIEKLDKNVLEDHEMLEALLFNAIPRRNTNDLAHRLLAQFGSIKGVFDASMSELKSVNGIGESVAAYLYCIGQFYKKYYEPNEQSYPEKYTSDKFVSFVKMQYAKITHEVLDFYFLNGVGDIIGWKRFTDKHEHHVVLNPALLAKYLMETKAEGVVAVHNHPVGTPFSSEYDDEATSKMQVVCSIQNVLLCDHIIFAGGDVYSYYQSGKMKKISNDYSLTNLFKQEKGE